MYIIICEIDHQSRFNAWGRVLRAGALGWPWGMGWGGRWEGGSGWGTRVHPWLIRVNVWQKLPQYCKVISLQLKFLKNLKKIKLIFIVSLYLPRRWGKHNKTTCVFVLFSLKFYFLCFILSLHSIWFFTPIQYIS